MQTLIDFTLDALDGCIHKCVGCQVIKTDNREITEKERDNIHGLLVNLKKQKPDGIFGIMVLGPTDFLVADNTLTIFKLMSPTMDLFSSIQLSSSMTYKQDWLIEHFTPFVPYLNGRTLRFSIPLHPRNIDNPSFHELVDSNLKTIMSLCPDSNIEKLVYQIIVTDIDIDHSPILKTTKDKLIGMVKDIDITIPSGRGNMRDINQILHLKNTVLHLKNLHEKHYHGPEKDPNSLSLLYSEGTSVEAKMLINNKIVAFEDYDLIYHKGRLYRPSFYGEEIVIYHDDFSVPWDKPDPNIIDLLEAKVTTLQIQHLTNECASCEWIESCMHNCIPLVQHTIKEKQCILPKENLKKWPLSKK